MNSKEQALRIKLLEEQIAKLQRERENNPPPHVIYQRGAQYYKR